MLTHRAHCLWIDFLKRVPVDQWSDRVKKDFIGTDKMPTEDFIKQNSMHLFAGPSSDLEVTQLFPGDTWDESKHLALLINPERPNAEIMDLVQRYLWLCRKEHQVGRPKFDPDKARYPFCSPPDINALEITLHIHDLRADDLKKAKPELKMWMLMDATQNEFPILPKQRLKDGDTPAEKVAKKKVLNATASRYLARAERIKAGVANGIFPAS